MAEASKLALANAILDEYGMTFSEELHIHIDHNTPSPLFQLLVFSMLVRDREGYETAAVSTRALFDRGWTTVKKMADAPWADRVAVLEKAGFAATDDTASNGSDYLGETAKLVLSEYDGDLRNLREAAEHDPEKERKLLLECRGMNDNGVDVFFREVQKSWSELFPFADSLALKCASRLELGSSPDSLAHLVDRDEYSRFIVGLVRVELENAYDHVKGMIAEY